MQRLSFGQTTPGDVNTLNGHSDWYCTWRSVGLYSSGCDVTSCVEQKTPRDVTARSSGLFILGLGNHTFDSEHLCCKLRALRLKDVGVYQASRVYWKGNPLHYGKCSVQCCWSSPQTPGIKLGFSWALMNRKHLRRAVLLNMLKTI